MKLLKIFFAALTIGLFSLSAAQAGKSTLKKPDGSKVKISCGGGLCTAKHYFPGDKEGGKPVILDSNNIRENVKLYKALGYK